MLKNYLLELNSLKLMTQGFRGENANNINQQAFFDLLKNVFRNKEFVYVEKNYWLSSENIEIKVSNL